MTQPVLDAIDVAILWDRLISIADEGAATLTRTSFSTLVRDSLDLSVMIFDAQGRMIAQSTKCIPVFIGTAPTTMAHMLAKYPPHTLSEGDVIVSNDPVIGTGHMFDMAVMRPIMRGGAIFGYAMSITHLPDIGGMGFSAAATEIYHEGLRLPIWKLFDRGRRDENLIDLLRLNVRVPEQVLGDIMANVSATEILSLQTLSFAEDYGLDSLTLLADAILGQTRAASGAAISALPDGVYSSALDVEAFDATRRLACRIEKRGERMRVDFAGSGDCVKFGINVPLPYTRAMALYAIKCATTPSLPNNDGATALIDIVAPIGCILNAVPPAPSAGRHTIGHFVPPLIFAALAEVIPERVMAGSGLINIMTFQGRRRDGSAFSLTHFAAGGFGALSDLDGRPTTPGSSNMGGTPVEVLEQLTDLTIGSKTIRIDSGGSGEFRGGPGQEVTFRNDTGHPVNLFAMANRTLFRADGFAGGGPGALREHLINGLPVPGQGRTELAPGDVLTLKEAGGGGFGPPERRSQAAIRDDIRRGFASSEEARRHYGEMPPPAE